MPTPMQIHRARIAAAKQRPGSGQGSGAGVEVIAHMPPAHQTLSPDTPLGRAKLSTFLAASLEEDLRTLKNMNGNERRGQYKRDQLLPRYRDHIKRFTDVGQTDPAIAYYLVWCFDAGQLEEALELAAWASEHGQKMPEGFKTDLAAFVHMQITAWANAELCASRSAEPYLSQMAALSDCHQWDVSDSLKAELYRLRGMQADLDGNIAEAVSFYEQGVALGAKVTTKLKNARKALEKATDPEPKTGNDN